MGYEQGRTAPRHILHVMRCQCGQYFKAIGRKGVRAYSYRCPSCGTMRCEEIPFNSDRGVTIAVATDVPWCTEWGVDRRPL